MNNNPEKKENNLSLDNLVINLRLYQWLKNSFSINSLEQIAQKTENEIKQAQGFSPKYLTDLKELLKENKLSFKKES